MSIEIQINMDLVRALEAIDIRLRSGPLDRCLKAYGQPIADYAKTIAPRSRSTGTRKKWSAKYKKNAAYQNDSGDNFGVKVLKSAVGVVIGAKYPRGNKQQFVHPSKRGGTYRKHILWGKKEADKPLRFPRDEQPIVKAVRTMQSAAEAAFRTQLEKEMKELKLG
jgi:hypothetical protein